MKIYEDVDDEVLDLFDSQMISELKTKKDILNFIFAGKAIFTIRNSETKKRFTFRMMQAKKDDNCHFVSLLTGSNNNFFGTVFDRKTFHYSYKKSKVYDTSFDRFLKRLLSDLPFSRQFHIWHEGVCGRCGKKLTVPESINIGLGPNCANKQQNRNV